jgi:hypothetical protein
MIEIIIMIQFFRATYSFESLGFLDVAEFARKHANLIDGSTVFTDPPFDKAALDLKAKAVTDAHLAYEQNHGDEEYATLQATHIELTGALKKNANYVTDIAGGSKTLIQSTGMVPTKDKSPVVKPLYSARPGVNKSTIDCFYNKQKGDKSVIWLCYPKSNTLPTIDKVIMEGTTSQKHTLELLDSGTNYDIYAATVKSKKPGKLKFILVATVPAT